MGFFSKNDDQNRQTDSPRQQLEVRYGNARHVLLLIVVFTAINIVLLLMNSDTYFLFSAYIPYVIVLMAMVLCGRLPEEFYGIPEVYEFLDSSLLVIGVAVAAVICGLYLLCWFLSKKNKVAWFIVALVLFSLDTVLMLLGGIGAESIVDIIFHGWAIVSLARGIHAHAQLKKLPDEEQMTSGTNLEYRSEE
jgi:hypothetical protein